MTAVESDAQTGTSFGAMSIARFIPRFTRPRILTSNIPTYRHSFSPPVEESQEESSSSDAIAEQSKAVDAHTKAVSKDGPSQPSRASHVEWNQLLPVPSNLLGSFRDLFDGHHKDDFAIGSSTAAEESDDSEKVSAASARPPPRLVFFGEQHHQPQVMRAQLQTLHALREQCRIASEAATSSSASPIYRLHLVLEHFSVLDQHMLNSFSDGRFDPDELADAYRTQSEESFHIGHYMPLLMLAKELKVPIWGGFPPRDWARQVFRNGVESIKQLEERRVNGNGIQKALPSSSSYSYDDKGQLPMQKLGYARPPISPLFTSWSAVTRIGAAHRSYLSGLFRPDLPPRFPELPSIAASCDDTARSKAEETIRHSPIYPTWLLKPHNIETKGFGPAQALKDSYLAHVTAWILRGARSDVVDSQDSSEKQAVSGKATLSLDTALPQQASSSASSESGESHRPVINVALVVAGLGHVEYGFGAPERVVQLLSQEGSSEDDTATVFPYIIASKPLDSGLWLGSEHPMQATEPADSVSQPISQAIEPQKQTLAPPTRDADAVRQWLNDPWGRKMADAVLLYDWIDDEPKDEANTNTDKQTSRSD